MRLLSLALVLAGLWSVLSGHTEPLIVGFGVLSLGLVVGLAHRMELADPEGHPIHLSLRAIPYTAWLIVEIVKSNLAVLRLVLSPRLEIQPQLIEVPASQRSSLGRVIFANSITMTPGTVSIDVRPDSILVHALTDESAAGVLDGEMDRRAAQVERRG